MATPRLVAAFVPGDLVQFIVGIQNAGSDEAELPVPRTLQPPEYFFSAVLFDADGRELYTSPRAKARLKLHPERPESYIDLAAGDILATVLRIEPDELVLESGAYRAELTYHPNAFLGPGGSGAPGALTGETSFHFGERR